MRAEDKNSLKNNYNPNLRLSAAKLLSLAGVKIRAQKGVAGREWKNMFPGRDEEAERRRRGLWTPPSSEASGGKGERCEKEERREEKRRRGNGSLTHWNFWTTTSSLSQSHYFFFFFFCRGLKRSWMSTPPLRWGQPHVRSDSSRSEPQMLHSLLSSLKIQLKSIIVTWAMFVGWIKKL